MDKARYFIAVLMLVGFPPAVMYWLVIHPFAGFWRKRGLLFSYSVVVPAMFLVGFGLFRARDRVLTVEFGTHWAIWVTALLSYITAVLIELRCRKVLSFRTLVGVPELSQDQSGRKLLSEGIYGKVRHPRYVGVTFGAVAATLFANYLSMYVILALTVVSLYLVARLEERELVQSLGEKYLQYRREVPMFIPKFF